MNTLYDSFITVFGEYTPIEATAQDGTIYDAINFGYIFSCLMALVCLYGVLRIFGSCISHRR